MHYIFLSEPRTERMLGEPMTHNRAAIDLGQDCGMHSETVRSRITIRKMVG